MHTERRERLPARSHIMMTPMMSTASLGKMRQFTGTQPHTHTHTHTTCTCSHSHIFRLRIVAHRYHLGLTCVPVCVCVCVRACVRACVCVCVCVCCNGDYLADAF